MSRRNDINKQLEKIKKQSLKLDKDAINYLLKEYKKNNCTIVEMTEQLFEINATAIDDELDKILNTIKYNSTEADIQIFVKQFIIFNKKRLNKNSFIKTPFESILEKFLEEIMGDSIPNPHAKFDLENVLNSNIKFDGKLVDCHTDLLATSIPVLSDQSIKKLLKLEHLWDRTCCATILANCNLSSLISDEIVKKLIKDINFLTLDGTYTGAYTLISLINDTKGQNHENIKDTLINFVLEKGFWISKLSIESMNADQIQRVFNKITNDTSTVVKFIENNINRWDYNYLIEIFNLFVKRNDIYNFYTICALLKDNGIDIIPDNIMDSYLNKMNITSENVKYLYEYILLFRSKDKDLIEKIKRSGNVKYIVLTAIYIDKNLFTELFDDNMSKCLCYVKNNPSFSDEDMTEIINRFFNEEIGEEINKKTDSRIQKLVDRSFDKNKN